MTQTFCKSNCFFPIRINWTSQFSFKANREDPDQAPQNATSNQGLHCLPMFHKYDARFTMYIWVIMLLNGKHKLCTETRCEH